MEKINIKRNEEDFYKIEVNDKGEYIEFDLTDVSLPYRILKASEELIKLDKEKAEQANEMLEKYKDDEEKLIEESIKFDELTFIKIRAIFDSFLGEGACQKIFGIKNNYEQFDMLLDELEPHFKKMEIKMKEAKSKLAKKYSVKDNEVI